MTKHTQNTNFMDQMKLPALPEVKFNKNGYEIRTDILAMAKDLVSQDFQVKLNGWEMTAKRDQETGKLVSTVSMPEFPNLDKILETAEKMYAFVSAAPNRNTK